MPDKSIDVCFFNGAIRNSENEHLAKLLRKKSRILIAFGSCAHEGCVPGLANLHDREAIFDRVYRTESTNNPHNLVPVSPVEVHEGELSKPEFYDTVRTLDQTVDVDYFIPGCPPPVDLIVNTLEAITAGTLPAKGKVLAPEKSVCDECPRKKENKAISRLYRLYEKTPEPETCLLEQGILCMGPATRAGCKAQCLQVDYPCTGCGGPCPNELEQGAAMLSALASIFGVTAEKEDDYRPEELIDQVKDPVGTFYKYSLPHSLINRKVKKE
jgi:F420-non-reducing hydrogenase small subunit